MDHKDADYKSAEAVIYGLLGENDELKKTIEKTKSLIKKTLNTDGHILSLIP